MKRCEGCGKEGYETTCPYAEEIHNTIIKVTLCERCYNERLMDI